jgi:hypothetical protein
MPLESMQTTHQAQQIQHHTASCLHAHHPSVPLQLLVLQAATVIRRASNTTAAITLEAYKNVRSVVGLSGGLAAWRLIAVVRVKCPAPQSSSSTSSSGSDSSEA